jgi:hypothetical protein
MDAKQVYAESPDEVPGVATYVNYRQKPDYSKN